MTTWARGQTRKPVHSPAMATKSMATLDKKEYMSQDRFSKWHLEEPPALLAVPQDYQHRRDEEPPTVLGVSRVEEPPVLLALPGGEHQHRGDEAQAVRLTERSPVSLRNLAL